MTLAILTYPLFRAFDANGLPLAGGKLYSYAAGSSTPLALLAGDGTTPLANPVILDAAGQAAIRFPSAAVKLNLLSALDVQQSGFPVDNISAANPGAIDDYSSSLAQMRIQTDPGEVGTEALATTLAGELERLRYAVYDVKHSLDAGVAYWYETPFASTVFNVKGYGATGDGATDDYAAIAATITAAAAAGGGTVYFPTGTYLVGTGLTGQSKVNLLGDGMGVSILKQKAAANQNWLIKYTSQANVFCRGLTFDFNRVNNTTQRSHGVLYFSSCSDILVDACELMGGVGDGVGTGGTSLGMGGTMNRVVVCHNYIHDFDTAAFRQSDGMYFSGSNLRCVGNYVNGATDTALVAEAKSTSASAPDSGITLTGNVCLDCAQAIYVGTLVAGTYMEGVTVTGNTCQGGTATNGAVIRAAKGATGDLRNVVIAGNTLRDTTNGHGIYMEAGGSNVVIAHNSIRAISPAQARHGIYVLTVSDVTIHGNIVVGCGGNGIQVIGSTSMTVSHNICDSNGVAASPSTFGIVLAKTGATECGDITLLGNRCTGQGRGILLSDASTSIVLAHNNCVGNTTAAITNSSTGEVRMYGNMTSASPGTYEAFAEADLEAVKIASGTGKLTGLLCATDTWDPGLLADNAAEVKTVSCAGAAVGDLAFASHSSLTTSQGLLVTAYAVANAVAVTITNQTGGNNDIASGTVKVVVLKIGT